MIVQKCPKEPYESHYLAAARKSLMNLIILLLSFT